MFSYTFSLDGSIAVEVRASGYIQSAFYAHNGDYGYQIHDALSGSMHDHVLNYKADFDILGTENSVQLVKNVPASKRYTCELIATASSPSLALPRVEKLGVSAAETGLTLRDHC